MKNLNDFEECARCAAKTGSPALCDSCLHNRRLISDLQVYINKLIEVNMKVTGLADTINFLIRKH